MKNPELLFILVNGGFFFGRKKYSYNNLITYLRIDRHSFYQTDRQISQLVLNDILVKYDKAFEII